MLRALLNDDGTRYVRFEKATAGWLLTSALNRRTISLLMWFGRDGQPLPALAFEKDLPVCIPVLLASEDDCYFSAVVALKEYALWL